MLCQVSSLSRFGIFRIACFIIIIVITIIITIIIIIISTIIITSNTWLAGPREARGCDNIFYWLGTNCKITESSTKYRRQNTNRNWTTTNCTITESSTKYRR